MSVTSLGTADARHFLLAVGGGLVFSLACLAAALGPAFPDCARAVAPCDHPTRL